MLVTSSTSGAMTGTIGETTGHVTVCADGEVAEDEVCFAPPLLIHVGKSLMDLVVLDVDQDGNSDILSVNPTAMDPSLLWWPGGGDGTFGEIQQQPTLGSPSSILVTDVNHDAVEDIVMTDMYAGGVRVHLNVGGELQNLQQIYASGPAPLAMAVGDLDADQRDDLVVTHDVGTKLAVLRGLPFGYQQPPAKYEIFPTGFGVIMGDLNADGDTDIISVSIEGFSDVFLGDGLGGLDLYGSSVELTTGSQLGLLDVTGDGALDLLCLHADLYVSAGDGAGGLGPAYVYPELYKPSSFAIADLTHDGVLDLAIGSSEAELITIFPGSDDGLGAPSAIATPNARRIVTADFNADGLLDLATILAAFGDDSVVVILSEP